MNKIIFLFTVAIFSSLSILANSKENASKSESKKMENKTWFQNKNFSSLRVRDYLNADADKPAYDKLIHDKIAIQKLVQLIESLPTEGEMMKSFSEDVPMLVLNFNYESSNTEIRFYRGKIKTPSTGFYSTPLEQETKAFELAKSLIK